MIKYSLVQYLLSFVFPIILEKIASDVNGSILVEYAYGAIRLRVNNYIQSGAYAEKILRYVFDHVSMREPKTILVLGVGGGSMIHFLRQKYVQTKITGVELDPQMIILAKKYFHLKKEVLTIHIQDAVDFIKQNTIQYDLIVDDLFIGCDRPKSADNKKYYQAIRHSLTPTGVYLANRSMLFRYNTQSTMVSKRLSNYFSTIEVLPRSPNIFFIGTNYQ